MAHLVTRMMRTEQEGKRPDPRVTSVEDVTRGLGLIDMDAAKIQNVLRSTRADYGLHPQLRVPRLPAARKALSEVLRSLDGVDSWIRQEIQRRALKWWRTQNVDYQQIPTIRHTVRKSLIKAEKPSKKKDKKPKIRMDVKDHPETEKGSHVEFHDDVTADLPGDADFQHHATEHAKHAAGYLTYKDQDPERAEAHLQAANLHARIGNALHRTGNAQNGGDLEGGDEQDQTGKFGERGADQNPGNLQDQDQNQKQGQGALESIHPYEGQKKAQSNSGGKDIEGKDLPAKPDNKRNPPGRDSELQVQRRYAGKDERGKTTDPKKDRSSSGVTINIANKSQVHTLRKSIHKFPHVFPLEKSDARGGKYLSRKPKPGGGWIYEYPEDKEKHLTEKIKWAEQELLFWQRQMQKPHISEIEKREFESHIAHWNEELELNRKSLQKHKDPSHVQRKIAEAQIRKRVQYTPEQLAAEEQRIQEWIRKRKT